jgi:hypothetical protein
MTPSIGASSAADWAFRLARVIHMGSLLAAAVVGVTLAFKDRHGLGVLVAALLIGCRGIFNWRLTRPYAEASGPRAYQRLAVSFPLGADVTGLSVLSFSLMAAPFDRAVLPYAVFVVPALLMATAMLIVEPWLLKRNARDAARNTELAS